MYIYNLSYFRWYNIECLFGSNPTLKKMISRKTTTTSVYQFVRGESTKTSPQIFRLSTYTGLTQKDITVIYVYG